MTTTLPSTLPPSTLTMSAKPPEQPGADHVRRDPLKPLDDFNLPPDGRDFWTDLDNGLIRSARFCGRAWQSVSGDSHKETMLRVRQGRIAVNALSVLVCPGMLLLSGMLALRHNVDLKDPITTASAVAEEAQFGDSVRALRLTLFGTLTTLTAAVLGFAIANPEPFWGWAALNFLTIQSHSFENYLRYAALPKPPPRRAPQMQPTFS